MSYGTPPEWYQGRWKVEEARRSLRLLGFTEAAQTLDAALVSYDAMTEYASALYAPGDVVTFHLNKYQLDNLTQFIEAVKERPEDKIGQWDTGDWWGEVLWKLRTLGGEKDKGNRGPV